MAGRPTDYRPDFHPADCERMGKLGRFTVQMAREWDVCVDTIYEWTHAHPIFSLAYTRAKNFRTAWWLDQAMLGLQTTDGDSFDSRLFGMMMRYDGVNMDERKVRLPELAACKTFSEQSTCIVGALAVGKITIKEANGIVDIVGKAARIDEVTELRRMLEEIEVARKQGRV